MKKIVLFLSFLSLSFLSALAQAPDSAKVDYTLGGYFDKVFDKSGNTYNLKDIRVTPSDGSPGLVSSFDCNKAGYFNLFYEEGWQGSATPTVADEYKKVFLPIIYGSLCIYRSCIG